MSACSGCALTSRGAKALIAERDAVGSRTSVLFGAGVAHALRRAGSLGAGAFAAKLGNEDARFIRSVHRRTGRRTCETRSSPLRAHRNSDTLTRMAGAAAGGALIGIMIGRNLVSLKEGITKAEKEWASIVGFSLESETMEGVLDKTSGPARPMLRGERGGVEVKVRIKSDMVHYAWTQISADLAEGIDATLGVHPSPGGALGYLRSLIGQDIEVGEEVFDAGYLITGKPESFAVAVLVPSVRELVTVLGQKLAAFHYSKEKVWVTLHGVETDPQILGAAIDLVASAAAYKAV